MKITHKARPPKARRAIVYAASKWEPYVYEGFLRALRQARKAFDNDKVTAALARGVPEIAVAYMPWAELEQALGENLLLPIRNARMEGMGAAMRGLRSDGVIRKGAGKPRKLTAEEISAIREYTRGGNKRINPALREAARLGEADANLVRVLDEIMAQRRAGAPVLYRGEPTGKQPLVGRGGDLVGLSQLEREARVRQLTDEYIRNQYKVGAVINHPAFVSTSEKLGPALDASVGRDTPGVVFRIRNGQGVNVSAQSSFDDEDEWVLPRDTKLKVTRVSREVFDTPSGGTVERTVVDVEFVGSRAGSAPPRPTNFQIGADVSFTLDNPRTQTYLARHGARLVRRVRDETTLAINRIVTEAHARGMDVRQQAQQIASALRRDMGLNQRQAGALSRYEAGLAEQAIPPRQAERQVNEYRDRLINQRARMIARHETMTASNAGQQEVWQQATEQGLIEPDQKRKWVTQPGLNSDNPCPICKPMNGQLRGLNEEFVSPYDNSAAIQPPIHIGCECVSVLHFED